jgi:hypothetical protein
MDGHAYRIGRLSTFAQLDVASRWNGVCMVMAYARDNCPPGTTESTLRKGINIATAGALGQVDAAAREDISRLLLSVVQREDESTKRWSPITAASGQLMFEADTQLAQLPWLFYNVIEHNGILDFFSVSPSTSGATKGMEESGQASRAARAGS